jgi:hypothetical protein
VTSSGNGARWRPEWLLLAVVIAVSACTVGHLTGDDGGRVDDPRNPRPVNYKSDLIAMLRVYLNNPTQIRDASLSEPILLPVVGGRNRWVVCLRLDAKRSSGQYTGSREYIAVFLAGRLDQLVDAKAEQCKAAEYQPFPEAETLVR